MARSTAHEHECFAIEHGRITARRDVGLNVRMRGIEREPQYRAAQRAAALEQQRIVRVEHDPAPGRDRFRHHELRIGE